MSMWTTHVARTDIVQEGEEVGRLVRYRNLGPTTRKSTGLLIASSGTVERFALTG